MIRKTTILALIICCLVWLVPAPVQAVGGLTVTATSAEMDFPLSLTFTISAESDHNINDIRLHYRVERMEHAQITSEVYIEFTPSTSISEEWVWDMRKTGGLPPGSSVDYWWTVTDAGGDSVQTDQATVPVEDNRYEWRTLTEGKVTLYWYEGGDAFAGEIMTATTDALGRLAANTGAELEEAIKIYLYANSQDLQGSMIFPQEWTGGVAFTRYGIIAIGISPSDIEWGKRAIAHELTHLVVHQVTFSPYGGLPTWLDEGLAMYAEGSLEPVFVSIMNGAIEQGSLISVQSLSSPFSAYAEDASLGYAESYSLVEYLIVNYGQEKMFELLETFDRGSGYDEALLKVYGFDMDGLDEMWREAIGAGSTPVASFR